MVQSPHSGGGDRLTGAKPLAGQAVEMATENIQQGQEVLFEQRQDPEGLLGHSEDLGGDRGAERGRAVVLAQEGRHGKRKGS